MGRPESLLAFAHSIDPERATRLERELGQAAGGPLAVLLATAFPPLAPVHGWQMDEIAAISREGWRSRRTRDLALARLAADAAPRDDLDGFRRALRKESFRQKARIALRELLPRSLGGTTVDVSARELSNLAEAAVDLALLEATRWATGRFGEPRRADGGLSALTVLGMGKLGGFELNAGSDIDLVLIYDTDEGAAGARSLHEFWTEVARRAVATLDTPTDDGMVWRVDLRLRPEGSQGPLVYSFAAAERYYETWGRLWERSAMLRARPIAGDIPLGEALFREVLEPFVFRRPVDPSIATSLAELVQKSRGELSRDGDRDLKLGRGGIREAEFFVQSLQLIWGGMEPSLRVTSSLTALDRLEARGLVTSREVRDIGHAYLLLRRAEHAIQWRTGLQTHALPREPEEMAILARILGYNGEGDFRYDLEMAREAVADRFASLQQEAPRPRARYAALLDELEDPTSALEGKVAAQFGEADVEDHLLALARRPDSLLGGLTRERFPELADRVLEAIRSSSNPEQAARLLRSFLGRFKSSDAYASLFAGEEGAAPRFISVFGASAFVGEAFVARPDLADVVLFGKGTPTVDEADRAVREEIESFEQEVGPETDPLDRREEFIGALRRAQWRLTVEVAVADLAGELDTRAVTRVLSALAGRVLSEAVSFEMGGDVTGLAVVAVGKLGAFDIGYGSDLDVLFIYDPAAAPAGSHPPEHFTRLAQRVVRLLGEPHAAGHGYDVDTRLRPSGSQGLLVTSLAAFARYHRVPLAGDDPGEHPQVLSSGAAWERQALLRARPAAGDLRLGEECVRIAHQAAYERGAPSPRELHAVRMRMERELGRERPGRADLKNGKGGLLDVEFAAQWLQMQHGHDPRVRTTDTVGALHALHDAGYLAREAFDALRDGYVFLRRLEARIRVVHGVGTTVLDGPARGLDTLARRMGIVRTAQKSEGEALLEAYEDITGEVRRGYQSVLGVE